MEKFQIEVLDLYYGETKRSLDQIAKKYNVSTEQCEQELQQLAMLSKKLKDLPDYEASQLSINKIMAYAKERAAQSKKQPFWQSFLKPVYGFATILVASVFSLYVWQMHYLKPAPKNVAINNNTSTVVPQDVVNSKARELLFTTPFDSRSFVFGNHAPKTRRYLNSNVSNVSVGNGHQTQYSFDDDLGFELSTKNLNSHELDTLYFRARKLEKLGYYKEALQDYIFISKFYPQFENQQVIPLAIARCYEKLGDKQSAISVLESYSRAYGESKDVDFWIDQLKSEAF